MGGSGPAAADTRYLTTDLHVEGSGAREFTIRADGALVPSAHPLTAVREDAEGLAATPDGRYLYVAEAGRRNRVHAFTIGADGALSSVSDSPFPARAPGPRPSR